MSSDGPHPPPRVTLWQRMGLWRAGLASSVSRYARDVFYNQSRRSTVRQRVRLGAQLGAIHAGWVDAQGHHGFADAWNSASLDGVPARLGPLAWLGHCTVLLRLGGLTILTDPVLSPKVGLRVGPVMVGARRLTPLLPFDQLPPIDVVLITHAHFDHLDKPTLRRLASNHTIVVTAERTGRLVPRGFLDVLELPWGERATVRGVSLAAVRPRHWGARAGWDRHRGYNSYVLEHEGRRVLFAGDTAHTGDFAGVGPVHLAVMGIGAYDPWEHAHATPEQALAMARDAQAAHLLPVHHSTFKLSDEPLDEPMRRLRAAAGVHAPAGTPRIVEAPMGRIVRLPD